MEKSDVCWSREKKPWVAPPNFMLGLIACWSQLIKAFKNMEYVMDERDMCHGIKNSLRRMTLVHPSLVARVAGPSYVP